MKPNVVLIMTDNHSPWTLGCYGNSEIRTPNLDNLASEGIHFTRAFCSNPVCSPNRATMLTGLMPSQHGVHDWLGKEKPDSQIGPSAYCTIEEFATLPGLLTEAGYSSGMCGKWHLGDSLYPQLGFDYWFAKPKGHTGSFYNDEAIWEGKIRTEEGYYLDAITVHAVEFLRQPREKPFFLYVGYNGPYGLDDDLRGEGHRNRHTDYYADKELPSFPREEMHPWLRSYRDCIGNQTARRSYAAAVSGVDDGVGAILQTLEDMGLAENTLVIFTSDHGMCAGHHGMWGMGDHSRPRHLYQENMQVPLILRHPQQIPVGRSCDTMVCNYDFFPTAVDYLGLDGCGSGRLPLPGRSYADALTGDELQWGEEIVFHEYIDTRGAQTRRWKLVRRYPDGPDEFYDLADDPEERVNLSEDPRYEESRSMMRAKLEEFFRTYSQPEYDLWNGGGSKAGQPVLDA